MPGLSRPTIALGLAGAVLLALEGSSIAARPGAAGSPRSAPAVDASVSPRGRSPAVVRAPELKPPRRATVAPNARGSSGALLDPVAPDRRRRQPRGEPPQDFGHRLMPGERFGFDVTFAGNPAGLAQAEIVSIDPDPRGPAPAGAPTLKIVGHARTSGVISLLATVTDDMTTVIDAHTGAAISSQNVLHYSGWSPAKYKHRVTEHSYEGRGYVRIVDTKDDKAKKKLKRVPVDTFDALSSMAWVRTLDLEKGEKATAHVVDGTTLMRVEIESLGTAPPPNMPSITRALELKDDDITAIRGVLTRVDEYDQPRPNKRVYKFGAWISNDRRRIPLVLESDMWVGAIRLTLNSYDPPSERTPSKGPQTRPSPASDPQNGGKNGAPGHGLRVQSVTRWYRGRS